MSRTTVLALFSPILACFLAGSMLAQDSGEKKVRVAKKKKIYSTSYLGKTPPELGGIKGDWINTKTPMSLAKLKGRVVWLEFSFIH